MMTDNHVVMFLKTCRLINARLTRWILAIQDYNMEIIHCKGKDNTYTDALCQITVNKEEQSNIKDQEELITSHIFRRRPRSPNRIVSDT